MWLVGVLVEALASIEDLAKILSLQLQIGFHLAQHMVLQSHHATIGLFSLMVHSILCRMCIALFRIVVVL